MRAVYFPHFDNKKNIIERDALHHLNVVRVKPQDPLLILDGKGNKFYSIILEINKRFAQIEVKKIETIARYHQFNLAISAPKRDAFWEILKIAVELGVPRIIPLTSDYSQFDFSIEEDGERAKRVMESALIQSNNAFIPEIESSRSLESFIGLDFDLIYFFNSHGKNEIANFKKPALDSNKVTKTVILVGPEGGFSKREIDLLLSSPKTNELSLDIPIMRSPTAVSTSIGYLLASCL